ncbi:MAG: mandelate racemase/muconate lactonizing enzyme family protein [Bryobacterales bacterium]|nr:mandelate racemase/muconate lactonizing enzyme family protein [Bryobacterales bacterium]MDE0621495.1 mandelate racemase/muconate lactonizing enzyme family protein [Bryobacterales bacterium]
MDRIATIETFSIRLPRDQAAVQGTAGSPTALKTGRFDYRWSDAYATLYSVNFEAALVKLTAESGLVGWGEAQAPLAPDVACLITEQLLRPAIEGQAFELSAQGVGALRERMYASMRVRGQTGGFMLDAIAGVDIALWDMVGRATGRPVWALLGGGPHPNSIPAYLSGLGGETTAARISQAEDAWERGFRTFKLFLERSPDDLIRLGTALRERFGPAIRIAVDALWHLNPATAKVFGRTLDELSALWLECPLPPEMLQAHARLAAEIKTPIALGESYRSRHELAPFLEQGCVGWLQPDLGRCGITEAVAIANHVAARHPQVQVVPHISIAMGPQIAAALHFSAAMPAVPMAEYNPSVFSVANQFLAEPLELVGSRYQVPQSPGLGIEIDEAAVRSVAQRPVLQPLAGP